MKVDIVLNEMEQRLILRFFDFTSDQLRQLAVTFAKLSFGEERLPLTIPLDESPGNSLRALHAKVVASDLGAAVVGPNIEWSLSPEGWLEVSGRASNIECGLPHTFQWLDHAGEVHILLSRSGQW